MPWCACIFARCWPGRARLQMREAQSFAWQRLPVTVTPVLPGTVPVLEWLAQEQQALNPVAL